MLSETKAPSRILTWGATLSVAACIVAMVASLIVFAKDIDNGARSGSQKLVSRALDSLGEEVAGKMIPQTYWDDAVVHLDNRFDPAWAKLMIGDYLTNVQALDVTLVVDRNDRIVMVQGEAGSKIEPKGLAATFAPMIAHIRRQELRRGMIPVNRKEEFRIAPIVSRGVVSIDGQPFVTAASLVQPDRFSRPVTDRSAIVIAGLELNSGSVAEMGARYLFSEMAIRSPTESVTEGKDSVAVRDQLGKVVAQLEWVPREPGRRLLEQSWPLILLFSLLVGTAIVAVTLRARRLTDSLIVSEARATHLAFHDSLTGLPNRAQLNTAFNRVAAKASSNGATLSMLCIDLDRFKAVNDSLGHQAGDALIRIIADRIRGAVRAEDEIIRYGGDEFLILQSHSDLAATDMLAARLIKEIAEPVRINGDRVFVGASIGIALCGENLHSADECLRRADLALYEAKEAGRNCWRHFGPAMDRQLQDRQKMRARLHDALEHGAIQLHYQPQVDHSGEIIGVEALSRWRTPDGDAVPPADFVQVAEETGLIDALGFYTLRQAFIDARRWPGLKVAVNLSAVQLKAKNFLSSLQALIDETGADPRQFEFEITERFLIADDHQTLETLKDLHEMGFRIALDDFGTGYSSLGYLQRYPIDRIKIDRSFVVRIDRDRQAQSVVVAIVQLAKALNLAVMAEGVETEQHRLCVAAAGCTEMQGFLSGHPVPAEKIAERLEPLLVG